jgi:transposase
MAATHRSQKRYPPELRERAVRMVLETFEQTGERLGVITRIARQLGIGPESLRTWVRQAEVDRGHRPGMTSAEQQRITELERQVKELQRANDILKAAASFFALVSGSLVSGGVRSFFRCPSCGWWLVPMCGPAGHPAPGGGVA